MGIKKKVRYCNLQFEIKTRALVISSDGSKKPISIVRIRLRRNRINVKYVLLLLVAGWNGGRERTQNQNSCPFIAYKILLRCNVLPVFRQKFYDINNILMYTTRVYVLRIKL